MKKPITTGKEYHGFETLSDIAQAQKSIQRSYNGRTYENNSFDEPSACYPAQPPLTYTIEVCSYCHGPINAYGYCLHGRSCQGGIRH